jgi:energy-coupling factor transport system ATP-binding protein
MALSFEKASYRYPGIDNLALKDISLTIQPGEGVLIAGASGSGKSTLCRAATGLVPHFHGGELIGSILVDGLDTRRHPVYQIFSRAGLVFQNPDAQLFNRTVEAELAYGLESLGLESVEIERRLDWASGMVGLRSLLGREPQALSGGEKQRVALAAVLALRPGLLLLDEPFTHLDSESSEGLRATLQVVRSEDIAVLVSEHRLHEIVSDLDRLMILSRGEIVADGRPGRILNQDVSAYGISLPPLVGLFRTLGWDGCPLAVDEALRLLNCGARPIPATLKTGPPQTRLDLPLGAPVIEMENVSFSYHGRPALCEVNLTFFKGECVALVGRNGAGKTTLLKHLNGLLKPEHGKITVLGHETRITPVAEMARHVGFAWQNANDQLFQPTVREEVLTGPRALRMVDPAWSDALFERFKLGPLLERSPFRLSEGQKKRVSFAAALAVKPEIIVLDEPTAGQDEPFRRELGLLIRELRSQGRTVVLVTHDLEFAAMHASRWIGLADGGIVADGAPEAVMADSKAMKRAGLRPTQRFQLVEALKDLGPHGEGHRKEILEVLSCLGQG